MNKGYLLEQPTTKVVEDSIKILSKKDDYSMETLFGAIHKLDSYATYNQTEDITKKGFFVKEKEKVVITTIESKQQKLKIEETKTIKNKIIDEISYETKYSYEGKDFDLSGSNSKDKKGVEIGRAVITNYSIDGSKSEITGSYAETKESIKDPLIKMINIGTIDVKTTTISTVKDNVTYEMKTVAKSDGTNNIIFSAKDVNGKEIKKPIVIDANDNPFLIFFINMPLFLKLLFLKLQNKKDSIIRGIVVNSDKVLNDYINFRSLFLLFQPNIYDKKLFNKAQRQLREEMFRDYTKTLPEMMSKSERQKEYIEALIKRFQNGSDEAQVVFLMSVKEGVVHVIEYNPNKDKRKPASYYDPNTGGVYMVKGEDMSDRGHGAIFFHEVGHLIDSEINSKNRLSNDEKFRKLLESDYNIYLLRKANEIYGKTIKQSELENNSSLKKDVNIEITPELIKNPKYWTEKHKPFDKLHKEIEKDLIGVNVKGYENDPDEYEGVRNAVSDLVSGLSQIEEEIPKYINGKSVITLKPIYTGEDPVRTKGSYSHGPDYWYSNEKPIEHWYKNNERIEMISVEAFAHFFDAQFSEEKASITREIFPQAFDYYTKIIEKYGQ